PAKPKKKAAASKKVQEELPKTYTLPNGVELKLQPGQTFGKIDSYGQHENIYVLTSSNKYDIVVYDTLGNQISGYWSTFGKLSPAKLKKVVKENGGDILAHWSIAATEKVDFSEAEPYSFEE